MNTRPGPLALSNQSGPALGGERNGDRASLYNARGGYGPRIRVPEPDEDGFAISIIGGRCLAAVPLQKTDRRDGQRDFGGFRIHDLPRTGGMDQDKRAPQARHHQDRGGVRGARVRGHGHAPSDHTVAPRQDLPHRAPELREQHDLRDPLARPGQDPRPPRHQLPPARPQRPLHLRGQQRLQSRHRRHHHLRHQEGRLRTQLDPTAQHQDPRRPPRPQDITLGPHLHGRDRHQRRRAVPHLRQPQTHPDVDRPPGRSHRRGRRQSHRPPRRLPQHPVAQLGRHGGVHLRGAQYGRPGFGRDLHLPHEGIQITKHEGRS